MTATKAQIDELLAGIAAACNVSVSTIQNSLDIAREVGMPFEVWLSFCRMMAARCGNNVELADGLLEATGKTWICVPGSNS